MALPPMPQRVSIFVTCLVDQIFPNVGLSMVKVLRRIGYDVEFLEGQTCCGQPAFNSGYRREAASVVAYFQDLFADREFIVVPSGSCTSMLKHHAAELFEPNSPEFKRAEALHSRIYEFSTFLTEVAGVTDVGARLPGIATYHDSCHALRELRVKSAPRVLLSAVQGLELRECDTAEECCGFGGTFSVKFADVSGAMARTKVESIVKTGANLVVSIDSSCLMQLQGALDRAKVNIRTVHLAEVLASQ
jgi:L-lactate dehydrogenase complex protein LldE